MGLLVSKRSTVTNMLESFNDWSIAVENGKSQTVAYIDFAKAFNSVCHAKLLVKLNGYGIKGSLLELIKCFLSCRTHRTKVGHCMSDIANITSGVVQGSCLGPILFLLYINDLSSVFTDNVCMELYLYGDDVKLYTRVKASSENDVGLPTLQTDIDKLAKWAQLWQLPVSYAKCSVMVLSCNKCQTEQFLRIDNHDIPCVSQVSDLGVTVDTRLKFSTNICVKVHRKANLIL